MKTISPRNFEAPLLGMVWLHLVVVAASLSLAGWMAWASWPACAAVLLGLRIGRVCDWKRILNRRWTRMDADGEEVEGGGLRVEGKRKRKKTMGVPVPAEEWWPGAGMSFEEEVEALLRERMGQRVLKDFPASAGGAVEPIRGERHEPRGTGGGDAIFQQNFPPKPQCSSGIHQSRPLPARSVKGG